MKYDFWQGPREKSEVLPSGLKVLKGKTEQGKFTLQIWRPKAMKPFANYYFSSSEWMEKYLKEAIDNFDGYLKLKAENRASRIPTKEQIDSVQIGMIFVYSWGYDQTNVEYFQVREKRGRQVIVQEIGQEILPNSGGSSMSAQVKPKKDAFLSNSEPIQKLLQFYKGEPFLSMSYSTGSLYKGGTNYSSWYA